MKNIIPYLKIARFDHWIKWLFMIPGIVFAFFLIPPGERSVPVVRIVMGLVSGCFIASANYVINEWLDAGFDKYHPVKKNRPAVTEQLKAPLVMAEYTLFAAAGLAVAWFVNRPVFVTGLVLFIMGIVYNVPPIRSKELPYLDVLSESINNALRLLTGWFCVTSTYQPPASIVLGYWLGGAFLMAAKRFAEYRMILTEGGGKTQAGLYRKSFIYYSEKSLLVSCFFYAMSSVFFCGIFMIKYRVELILAIPFLCGLFCVYLMLCYKPDSSAQKPEKLFREKALMLYILFFVVVTVLLMKFSLPFLQRFLETSLMGI